MNIELIESIALAILALERVLLMVFNERKKYASNLKRTTKATAINSLLKQLSHDVGADHVLRFMFHNGGKMATGESMDKVTILEDIHSPAISSISHLFQNVPFERVPILISKLSTNASIEYQGGQAEDSVLTQVFGLTSIVHFYGISIVKRNKIVGFIAVSTDQMNKRITEADKAKIADTVLAIKKLI